MSAVLSSIGRGADSAQHTVSMLLHGLWKGLVWAGLVFSLIFSLVFTTITSSETRSIFYRHTWLSLTSTFSSSVKTEVAGKKIPAQVFFELVKGDGELSERLRNARIAAGVSVVAAGLPAVALLLVVIALFGLIGDMLARDEHIRGAQILDSVEDFNRLNDMKNVRGVERVERPWVKRLRDFK